MDGQRFDRISRFLASGVSRREVLRALAVSAGASVIATVGRDSVVETAFAATKLRLRRSPKVTYDASSAIVSLDLTQPAWCLVEFGPTKSFGNQTAAASKGTNHTIVLPNLAPKTRYYYRVVLESETETVTTRVYQFRTPSCPATTTQCNGSCVPTCGHNQTLTTNDCTCACQPGFADCDGDPANGCKTALDSVEHCLACGVNCDDGNACTTNTCDPDAGCVTTNIEDGTACGTEGVCDSGVCVACVAGGTCQVDADCCDDEACCEGACVAKDTFLDDNDHCGACGNACSALSCQTVACIAGTCEASPVAEGDACDDGNPCTEGDHCMAGSCMGNPVAEGTPCDDGGVCNSDGVCIVCTAGNTCTADQECCAGESCCAGTCVARTSFASDPANCGTCGIICDTENACQQATCEDGGCGTTDRADGEACDDANPCTDQAVCGGGICVGEPLTDGTLCGIEGTCQNGECIEPHAIGATDVGPFFEDTFESGTLSKWSTTKGLKVQTSIVAAGTYAARATGSQTVAYARKSLSPTQRDLAYRTRFQIISQGNTSVNLLRLYKSSSSLLLSLFITSAGKIATLNRVTGATTTSATTIAKGAWYDIQLRAKVAGTSSLVEVWLNGAKIADLSKTVNLGTTAISMIQLGEDTIGRTYDVAFDDTAVCVGDICQVSETVPPDPSGPSTAPGATSGVLMATYAHNSKGGVNWAKVTYRPRQFKTGLTIDDPTRGALRVDDVGPYTDWDIFTPYNYSVHRVETRSDWTVLELTRPSTLAIVWRGGATLPSWLSAWTKSNDVVVAAKTFPTFRKTFAAGKVTLGAVYNPTDSPGNATRDTYWVLLAETDDRPSPAPTVATGREAPIPNATCPAWVHDQYVTTGPDGQTYPTWHHLIDPVYWCYHRHDHGTNPANFSPGKKPAFGYTAAKHGMSEPHAGFKNYVFDSQTGSRWMLTHHFGTAGIARACNRFHTVDIVVRSIATGELLADLHIMGDFGRSVVNATNAALTPTACPDQAIQAAGSTGIRMIPSQADGAVGYEPWRVDLSKTLFGFIGDFTVNNPDPIVICNSATCDQAVSTGFSGSKRFFTSNASSRGATFGITAGQSTGTFYTDPMGQKILSADDPMAVRQYIKPGANVTASVSGHCYDVFAWGNMLVCGAIDGKSTNREGSIQAPN